MVAYSSILLNWLQPYLTELDIEYLETWYGSARFGTSIFPQCTVVDAMANNIHFFANGDIHDVVR